MDAKYLNVWWQDARRLGLKIEEVGKAYIALDGIDRRRVFWHGNESKEALTWLLTAAAEVER